MGSNTAKKQLSIYSVRDDNFESIIVSPHKKSIHKISQVVIVSNAEIGQGEIGPNAKQKVAIKHSGGFSNNTCDALILSTHA
jgi:hypothetical protein